MFYEATVELRGVSYHGQFGSTDAIHLASLVQSAYEGDEAKYQSFHSKLISIFPGLKTDVFVREREDGSKMYGFTQSEVLTLLKPIVKVAEEEAGLAAPVAVEQKKEMTLPPAIDHPGKEEPMIGPNVTTASAGDLNVVKL